MPSEPHKRKIVHKAVAPAEALSALRDVVAAGQEYLTLRQQEMTKREVIGAYRVLETERIRAAEAILKAYFEQAYAERARNFDELLQRLDKAAEEGDATGVSDMLKAIVAIAQSSPLNDVGDLSMIRKALDDPDHVWQL